MRENLVSAFKVLLWLGITIAVCHPQGYYLPNSQIPQVQYQQPPQGYQQQQQQQEYQQQHVSASNVQPNYAINPAVQQQYQQQYQQQQQHQIYQVQQNHPVPQQQSLVQPNYIVSSTRPQQSYDPPPSGLVIQTVPTAQNEFSSIIPKSIMGLPPSPLPNIPNIPEPLTNDDRLASIISNQFFQNVIPEGETITFFGEFDPKMNELNSAPIFNKTDVVVVKTQKKTIAIPMKMSDRITSLTSDQMNNLPSYIVNQYLFFFKPQTVNFLNKVV